MALMGVFWTTHAESRPGQHSFASRQLPARAAGAATSAHRTATATVQAPNATGRTAATAAIRRRRRRSNSAIVTGRRRTAAVTMYDIIYNVTVTWLRITFGGDGDCDDGDGGAGRSDSV